MSDEEIMKALDDEINSCIENHYEEALTANLCLRNMILRLQKENAELRECLKEAVEAFVVEAASHVHYTKELNKWRAALVNDSNEEMK